MPGRWSILALLFTVRATMGFQHQSVPALAPLIGRDFGVGLADIGLLIGLYLAPGVALALPGGAIGRWFGDKRVVLAGLALMFAGGAIMALVPSWEAQIAGRLIAGMGGVLLNVSMSKMITDWFAGREIATAMAVFVNSWPVGIALALVTLPPIAAAQGVAAAYLAATALVALGAVLLAAFYASPPTAAGAAETNAWPGGSALAAVMVAGVIWGLYNIAFAMIFSFGPTMLAERGWPIAEAGSAVSIVLWLAVVSVPLGGVLADRTRHHDAIMLAGFAAFAVALVAASRADAVIAAFVALGLIGGLPAGPIVALPSRVLAPATRAIGMGVFFTLFYIGMFIAPAIAGRIAAWAGSSGAAFDFGAAALVACVPLVWVFQRLAAKGHSQASAAAISARTARL